MEYVRGWESNSTANFDENWASFKQQFQLNERIEKVDGEYVVYPKKGGKRLGTHKTRKEAQKQLAAIEISKAQHAR